jgi:AcrR family transcriptional regulator
MSPRAYRLGQRQAATEQTKARIISAARELLMASEGFSSFSIDQVARQADVARMTIYHQFGSKSGLLEALCDALAASGGMEQLAIAFRQPEPLDVLNQYLQVFSRFWDTDRLVTRRLRALAALDPDFEQVIRARDERRRQGVRVITQRLIEQHMLAPDVSVEEIVDVLFTLSSFETFETLAGPTRSLQEVAPLVCQIARAALHL